MRTVACINASTVAFVLTVSAKPRRRQPISMTANTSSRTPWNPVADVVFVDTVDGLTHASKSLQRSVAIGFDTETKPVFKSNAPRQPPALLQLCGTETVDTHCEPTTRVFLFDLLNLLPHAAEHFDSTIGTLFGREDVLLLGVGIEQDLRNLHDMYSTCCCFRRVKSVIDVGFVKEHWSGADEHKGKRQWKQLAARELAARYAGITLSKQQQKSNWARRPLTNAQLQYAANDARAMVHVFCNVGEDGFREKFTVDTTMRRVWRCKKCHKTNSSRNRLMRVCECGSHRRLEALIVAEDQS